MNMGKRHSPHISAASLQRGSAGAGNDHLRNGGAGPIERGGGGHAKAMPGGTGLVLDMFRWGGVLGSWSKGKSLPFLGKN